MVFIVGARRSGTNWLQRALTAHPAVAAVPGETYLFQAIQPLGEIVQHDIAGSARTASIFVDRDVFLDGTRDLCDQIFLGILARVKPPARLLVERTPWHVYSLDMISSIYPDAAVLHLVRDGRDVARSLVAQPWGPSSIREAAEEWKASVEAGRAGAEKIERFREVRYESLLADPKVHLAEVYDFLGLDRDDSVLKAALVEMEVPYNLVPGERGVAQQKWRTGLSGAELREFDTVAGPELAALGYDESPTVPAPSPPLARSVAQAARRRFGRQAMARHRDRALQLRVHASQEVAHAFLQCVSEPSEARLADLMTPNARVHVVGSDASWEGRGEDARQQLLETLRSDPALGHPQRRGAIHPGVPTWTAVLDFDVSGRSARRIVVLAISGERVTAVTYYAGVE